MKKIWLGIGAAVIVVLLLLQARFIEYMILDDSGYAIPSTTVKQMLMSDIDKEPETLEVPFLRYEVLEHIFKRGNLFYMGEKKKSQINLAYPLYINDCAGIYFVSDTGSLFDEEFDQQKVYSGLRVQNRVAYNPGGDRADAADYLFAGIGDDLFINLCDITYTDRGEERRIVSNSVIYFTEEYFTYCEPEDGVGHYQLCRNVSDLKVRMAGEEYGYRELLLKLQVIFEKKKKPEKDIAKKPEKEEEIPEIEDWDGDSLVDDTQVNDEVVETVATTQVTGERRKRNPGTAQPPEPAPRPATSGEGTSVKRPHPGGGGHGGNGNNGSMGVRPDEMRPDKAPSGGGGGESTGESAPIGYVKPTVKLNSTSAGVYRLMLDITVNDPARRLHPKRKVQFEFYEQLANGREQLAYRTFTGSSGVMTAGNGSIKPGTSYRVKVYFTYYDEKEETIVEDVYEDVLTTAAFDTLQPINLGDIDIDTFYDNYVLLPMVHYADGSDEEAVYGINNMTGIKLTLEGVKVTDPNYKGTNTTADVNSIRNFKKHMNVNITSSRNLPANSEYKYTLTFEDYFGNKLKVTNNTGTVRTCKSRPTGKLEVKKNEIGNTQLIVTLVDNDATAVKNDAGDYEIYLVLSTSKFAVTDLPEDIREICLNDDDTDGVRKKDVFLFKSDGVYCLDDPGTKLLKDDGTPAEGYDTSTGGLAINSSVVKLEKLLLNTRYTAYLFSRFDLQNNKGVQEFGEIANFSFTSASLNSLGKIYIKTDISQIAAHSAVISYTLNVDRTNDILRSLLSDVKFDIVRTNGEEEVADSNMKFNVVDDLGAMVMFTGLLDGKAPTQQDLFDRELTVTDGDVLIGPTVSDIPGAIVMDATFYNEDELNDRHPLKSKTDYKIVPEIFATYDGEKYPMDVVLTADAFTTLKEPARVEVTNVLLGAEHLMFDSRVIDEDDAIIGNSGHKVIVNIYQDNGTFISAKRILKNTEDPEHIDLSNIDTDRNYKITYIAQEYNEGYNNATYVANKVIAEVMVTDSVRLSGDIKLIELRSDYRADLKVDMFDVDKNLMNIPYYVSVEEVTKAATATTPEVLTDVTNTTSVTPKVRTDYIITEDINGRSRDTMMFRWADADSSSTDVYKPEEDGLWRVPESMYPDSGKYENRNKKYPLHFEPSYGLKRNKTYVFSLYTIISNQKLVMDTLRFSTEEPIQKITTPEEFVWKIKNDPDGRFVVSEDIKLRAKQAYVKPEGTETQTARNITNIFEGQINFQGYTLDYEMDDSTQYEVGLFNNLAETAEIFDAVFDFRGPVGEHEEGFTRWNCSGGLADRNYGHIHDVIVNYRGGGGYQNTSFGLLFRWNTVSGTIENFVVANIPDKGTNGFTAYTTCGLLCGTNYGIIRNGYAYGDNIFTDTAEYSVGGSVEIGGICGVASTTSKIENVFSLVNVEVPSQLRSKNESTYNYHYAAVVGKDSGHTKNCFSVGLSTFIPTDTSDTKVRYNNTNDNTGPVVGNKDAKTSRVYYYNAQNANFSKHKKQIQIGLTTLYDYGWHSQILGDQFDTSPVEVGYYPHVELSSELPAQEYIELPARQSKTTVDFMSAEFINYIGEDEDSALLKFRFYNPQSVDITGINIENLTVVVDLNSIVSEDGYTDLYATVSNPTKYMSSYEIKSVVYEKGGKTAPPVTFTPAPLLLVDFYRPIYTANDWVNYVKKNVSENAKLRADIDFSKMMNGEMRVTSSFSGKLDGNGYSINNISLPNYSLFSDIDTDGSVSNMYIRNYKSGIYDEKGKEQTNRETSTGLIFKNHGTVSGLHVRGIELSGYQYLGGLVSYSYSGSVISDCTMKDVTLNYREPTRCATKGYIGGISAYVENVTIQNCYVQELIVNAADMADCGGVGGIAGYVTGGYIDSVYTAGPSKDRDTSDRPRSKMEVRGSYVGGIVGYFNFNGLNSGLKNVFAGVSVEGYQSYIGGIVGYITENEMMRRDTNLSGVALDNVLANNPDAVGVSYAAGWCPQDSSKWWPKFNGTDTQSLNGILLMEHNKPDGTGNSSGPALLARETDNYKIINVDDMIKPEYYTDTLKLKNYDFSKTADGFMPWLRTSDGKSLLPDQEDTYLSGYYDPRKQSPIKITNVIIDSSQNHYITLRYTSEHGEILSYAKIGDLVYAKNSDGSEVSPMITKEWTRFKYADEAQQTRWKDSYMMTEIEYYSPDDPDTKMTANVEWNPVRIPLTLYLRLTDSKMWGEYIGPKNNYGNFDNYLVALDELDFTGTQSTTNARLGRLKGGNVSGKTKVSNLNLKAENFVYRINSELGNLIFSDCSVNASSGATEAMGLIGLCAAEVHDVEFNSIYIDSTSTCTGIIGKQLGSTVQKVTLNNVNVNTRISGRNGLVGGLIGFADNDTKIQDISGENLTVNGSYDVGGIVGRATKVQFNYNNMAGGVTGTKIVVRDVKITGTGEYVGGIIGRYNGGWSSPYYAYGLEVYGTPVTRAVTEDDKYVDAGKGIITDSSTVITGKSNYVGGIAGRMLENGNGSTSYPHKVDGVIVQGKYNYVGGAFGYAYHISGTTVSNTLIRHYETATGVYSRIGGVIGNINAAMTYCYADNVRIEMNDVRDVGFLAGYNEGNGNIENSYVKDSVMVLKESASSKNCYEVGGIAGWSNREIKQCGVTNSIIYAQGYNVVGGIVGTMHSHVTRCFFYGEPMDPAGDPAAESKYVIYGDTNVGGLTGQQYNNYTQCSYSNANVVAVSYGAGGMIGYYRNSYTSSGTRITGFSSAGLNNCYFAGTVKAGTEAGGAIGRVTMLFDGAVDPAHRARVGRKNDNSIDGGKFGNVRNGSSNESVYTRRNIVLAKSVEATNSTGTAYAFAGNYDAFEGGANLVGKTDGSTYDRAEHTFFWAGMTIKQGNKAEQRLYEMDRKDLYYPDKNTGGNSGNYGNLYWDNTKTTYSGYDTGLGSGANVRILKHGDFGDYRMWRNIRWHETTDSERYRTNGVYYVLFREGITPDSTVKTELNSAGYADTDILKGGTFKALLPAVRINANTSSLNDSEVQRQAKYAKPYLPVPAGGTGSLSTAYAPQDDVETYVTAYAADADRINVEFSQNYVDGGARFSVSYGGKVIDEATVERRVYTYSYDYGRNVTVNVWFDDGSGSDEVNYLPAQLERHVMTWGNEYYYIPKEQNGIVHGTGAAANGGSAGLISGKFITIYNGHALREDGAVIDVTDGKLVREVAAGLSLIDEVVPMQTFNYGDIRVETYNRFSEFVSGTLVSQNAQFLMAKNGVVGNVSGLMENVKDSIALYNKDGEHEVILGTDGIMVNILGMNRKGMEDIGAPEDFKNSGIVYMTNNLNSSQPFILVEYANRGSMVGYNYMTGEYLFNLYESNYVSLTDYLTQYFSGSVSKYANLYASYAPNQELIDKTGTADRLANVVTGNSSKTDIRGNSTGEDTVETGDGMRTDGETDKTDGNGEDADGYVAMYDTGLEGGVQDSELLDGQTGDEEGVLVTEEMLKETEATTAAAPASDESEDGYNSTEKGKAHVEGSSTSGERGPGKDGESEDGTEVNGSSDANGRVKDSDGSSTASGTEGGNVIQNTENDLTAAASDEKQEAYSEKDDEKDPDRQKADDEQEPDEEDDEKDADSAKGSGGKKDKDEEDPLSGKHVIVRKSTAGTPVGEGNADGVAIPKSNINNGDRPAAQTGGSGSEETDESDTEKVVENTTKLITVYNMATGTFEIVDMRQYMTDQNYRSENAKLQIQDLGAYAQEHGYAEKIVEKKRADGLLLYLAIALTVFAGTAGILVFRRKNKL